MNGRATTRCLFLAALVLLLVGCGTSGRVGTGDTGHPEAPAVAPGGSSRIPASPPRDRGSQAAPPGGRPAGPTPLGWKPGMPVPKATPPSASPGAGAGPSGASAVPDACSLPTPVAGETLSCCEGEICHGGCQPTAGEPSKCVCRTGPGCIDGKVCCGKLGCVSAPTCEHAAPVPQLVVTSECEGLPCSGWCEWKADGTRECTCYGAKGGCGGKGVCNAKYQGCQLPHEEPPRVLRRAQVHE
jgi:hypothetical protein